MALAPIDNRDAQGEGGPLAESRRASEEAARRRHGQSVNMMVGRDDRYHQVSSPER